MSLIINIALLSGNSRNMSFVKDAFSVFFYSSLNVNIGALVEHLWTKYTSEFW